MMLQVETNEGEFWHYDFEYFFLDISSNQ